MAEKEALLHSEPKPNSPKRDENHEESSNDEDYDSDASTEIEVAEGMKDLMLDDEIVLGAFARQQPRPIFWDTFIESSVVKMSFLIGMDSVGSFTYLYMKYGASVKWPLIVYLLVLGLPVLLLELSLGQFTSLNPSSLYKRMIPAFGGMGFSIVLLNFALISGQVQQAALYTGLFIETITSGKTYKLYETCTMDYNNQKCMVASTNCPKNEALLIDSRCTTNITYKYNTLAMNTGSVAKNLPYVFPLYQFLFRGILGEADNMMVLSEHTTGIFTYAAIWLFLMLVTTKAGAKIIKWTAILANTSLLAYIFTYTIIWLFCERPFTFDIQQLAELDTNFSKTTLTEDASWWMWFDVAIHIMTNMGLGDGGIITIASNQSFTSSILIDAVLISVVWGVVPYVLANCTQPLAINQIYQMVKRSQGYTHGNSTFISGYHGYIRKATYHTNMFSLALGLMAFKDFDDGLLGIFCVAGFFLVMTNVVIRFEIISSCLSEQIVGLKKVTYACRVRAVVVLGLLILLFTTHQHGLHLLDAFYNYSLIIVTSFIIIMEVLICFIYSPRRIFANINATEIAWSLVSRSRRFHQCLEVLSLFAIASWLLVPVVLIGVVVTHYAKAEEDVEFQSFSHKLMGFLMSVFVLVPIFLIFFKRMYMVVKSKTKLSLEFKPNRHLWGPRRANDRALAHHVEREYRVHF